jgi:HlyD family secretion protein
MIFTLGAFVLLAIAYGFLPRPVPVDFARVIRGPLRVTIEEEGETRVKERFIISAPVAGFMRRIKLKVGDLVKKGQNIAELEPLRSDVLDPRSRAEAEANVLAAESSLRAAEEQARAAAADEEYTRKKLERVEKLFLAGVISKDQLDQVDAEAKHMRATLLSKEATVKVARTEVEFCSRSRSQSRPNRCVMESSQWSNP